MTHPYLRYFEEQKAATTARVTANTARYRTAFADITVNGANGQPIPDAKIRFTQKSHEFKFGCNLFMLDQFPDEEHNRAYRARFPEIFNYAIVPFYWKDFEPEQGHPRFTADSKPVYRRPNTETTVRYCREVGLAMKGHPLFWHCFLPDWLPQNGEAVMQLLEGRISQIADRCRDDIGDFDVVNESCSRNYADRRLARDYVLRTFAMADRYMNKSNRLLINETTDRSFGTRYCAEDSQYRLQIENLRRGGARINAIGLQYHMFYKPEYMESEGAKMYYNPERMFDVLDTYGEYRLPLHISEITVPAYSLTDESKEMQAMITEQLYRIWFSHPQMDAIVWWNFVDSTAAYAPLGSKEGENYYGGGLLNYDMTDKPVMRALRRLIHEEWHTDMTVGTGESGVAPVSGYFGNYEVTVTAGDKTRVFPVSLTRAGTRHFTLTMKD